jgi:hypothetical protein
MRTLAILGLLGVGCTSQVPPLSGGDPGPLTTPAASVGGGGADNGDNGGGGTGGSTNLPPLASGSYSAVSSGLTANNCQTTPAGADLGTWTVKVVNPAIWNVTIDPGMPIAVLDLSGAFFVGDTSDQAMPLWGCMMSETWNLRFTPTSTTSADGSAEMVLDKVSGDCTQYEPVLPCKTGYAVGLTKM